MKDNVSIVNVLHRNTLSNTVMSVINMFVLIKKYHCDHMNVPEMLFDEISTCGYCQLKKKLSDEDRKNFEDNEKDLEEKIKLLNEDLFKLYKQLGNL